MKGETVYHYRENFLEKKGKCHYLSFAYDAENGSFTNIFSILLKYIFWGLWFCYFSSKMVKNKNVNDYYNYGFKFQNI